METEYVVPGPFADAFRQLEVFDTGDQGNNVVTFCWEGLLCRMEQVNPGVFVTDIAENPLPENLRETALPFDRTRPCPIFSQDGYLLGRWTGSGFKSMADCQKDSYPKAASPLTIGRRPEDVGVVIGPVKETYGKSLRSGASDDRDLITPVRPSEVWENSITEEHFRRQLADEVSRGPVNVSPIRLPKKGPKYKLDEAKRNLKTCWTCAVSSVTYGLEALFEMADEKLAEMGL